MGSANYRRAGYQAQIKLAIPNSVTGNVLPNKVNTDNLSKTEVPQSKATISYLNAKGVVAPPKRHQSRGTESSPRNSVSSATSEPPMNGRKVSKVVVCVCVALWLLSLLPVASLM